MAKLINIKHYEEYHKGLRYANLLLEEFSDKIEELTVNLATSKKWKEWSDNHIEGENFTFSYEMLANTGDPNVDLLFTLLEHINDVQEKIEKPNESLIEKLPVENSRTKVSDAISFEAHPFSPFNIENADRLFLGSFPVKAMIQNDNSENWYYGSNRNHFWVILQAIYDTSLITKDEKESFLIANKFGIADIIGGCTRRGNSNLDNDLQDIKINKYVFDKILKSNVKEIICTSAFVKKLLEKELLENSKNNGNKFIISVMPSPSPSANRAIGRDKEYKLFKTENPDKATLDYKILLTKKILMK
ncbi:MAG: hypothetical protein WCH34_07415 [Bacteroidota bacterium]